MMDMNMDKPIYYKTPLGSESRQIPFAAMAGSRTSVELVPDSAPDAYYFRALEEKGIRLNGPQIQAVRHHKGPLLTLAGAGSGKTSVLVCRTGYLMTLHRVEPEHILLVTFTKKASLEMKERISGLPGISRGIASRVQASTFHAFFLKLIRHKGYIQEIMGADRYKQIVIKKILREMNLHDSYQPEELLSLLSSYKMNRIGMDALPELTPADREMKQVFERYEEWKRQSNKIDYDDILVLAYELLLKSPGLLQSLQHRFQYVMVDEFQDTNELQYELIRMIVESHGNLFVVGDDDQTIYTFNGARTEFILNFESAYPQAKTVTLDINYRSASSIVGLGNEVIRRNVERKAKSLKAAKRTETTPQYITPATTDEEAETVIRQIHHMISEGNRSFRDIAILHRTASCSRAMFEQLALHNLPFISYSMGNEVFYEQWIVKPVIDHLRLAVNPRDFDSLPAAVHGLFIHKEKGTDYIWHEEQKSRKKYPLVHLVSFPETKSYQKDKIKERIQLIKDLVQLKPAAAIRKIRSDFYDKLLEAADRQTTTAHKETIKETLDELEASAKRFETVMEFLAFIDQMIEKHREIESLQKDTNADAISLMTIHRSKGLEFPAVFLIGASEGILPHSSALEADKMKDMVAEGGRDKGSRLQAALEEERRLAYVAITRAMEELYISSPAYYRGKKTEVSRFLREPFLPAGSGSAPAKPDAAVPAVKPSSPPTRKPVSASSVSGKAATETVSAWLCTDAGCKAWSRIVSDKESETKVCPLCGCRMRKGNKEIPVSG